MSEETHDADIAAPRGHRVLGRHLGDLRVHPAGGDERRDHAREGLPRGRRHAGRRLHPRAHVAHGRPAGADLDRRHRPVGRHLRPVPRRRRAVLLRHVVGHGELADDLRVLPRRRGPRQLVLAPDQQADPDADQLDLARGGRRVHPRPALPVQPGRLRRHHLDRGHRPVRRLHRAGVPAPAGRQEVPGRPVDARPLEPADRDRGHDLGGVHLHPVHAPAGLPDHDPAPSTTRRSCSWSSSAARRSGTSPRPRTGSRAPRSRARPRSWPRSSATSSNWPDPPSRARPSPEAPPPGSSIPGPDRLPERGRAAAMLGPWRPAHFLLDIGLALLLAAAFGWVARKLGLPAVVGYLAAGLAVSPFTPGYVADRHQIELLAERRRRPPPVRGRHRGRPRPPPARARRPAVGVAARRSASRPRSRRPCCYALGVAPLGAALVGLSVAMSSSVVVVNITRSRRRTTDKPTEEGLLGWSVLQDVTGVALGDGDPRASRARTAGRCRWRSRCSPPSGSWRSSRRQVLPILLRRLRSEHDLFLIVSVASGLALAAAGAVFFGVPPALAAFVAGLAISDRAETGRGPPPPAAVPRRLRRAVLRRRRHADRSRQPARRRP